MGTVAAIGEQIKVAGLALAGVTVHPAESRDGARAAWNALPDHVTLVIVTPAVADALGPAVLEGTHPLTVVMPS